MIFLSFYRYWLRSWRRPHWPASSSTRLAYVDVGLRVERPLDVPEMLELCQMFLVGGNETTSSFISNSMLLMLKHPQFELVRKDMSLLPAFLEESLRVESPAQWLGRVVPEGGAQLGGVDMPAGSRALLSWASANRDPDRFEGPDDFDFQRERADHHVSFGYANHYCIELHLARAEARIAFEVILSKLTDIRLDEGAEPLEYGSSPVLRIPKRLPLLFDALGPELIRHDPATSDLDRKRPTYD